MDFELLGYQQTLLNNIITSLDEDGRAGLELFTSGGKSLIGLKLIEHYVEKTGKKVMWIAPRAALNNVKSRYIDNSEYSGYVECVSLNILSRLNKILNKKSEYKQYTMIIIDEAHKLMAKNAYEQFQRELMKFNRNVKLFAMTASSYRNLDGIRSLEEITQGGKIYRYNLSDAINEDIANPVIYYGTALEYNKRCYQALDVLRNKYGSIPYVQYILNHVSNKLKESEDDTELKVVNFLKDKVKFKANSGDRHIIFFSRIAELKEQKDMVYNIMKKWYSGVRNVEINIIEYHGELTSKESASALRKINAPATRRTVDVILTVDKGAESIHPENIRSIILFRGTQSMIKFTQMIGRVITLTIENKQANYVFDFCKSVSLIGANTIAVGHRKIDDRIDMSSDMTPEQLLGDALKIKSQISSNSFIEINLDQTIEELNELFDRLGAMYNMLEASKKVVEFIKDKLDVIDRNYNGNIAKYLMNVNPELGKIYRKLQSAIMYQSLSMGDIDAISQMMSEAVGDRMYLTFKMTTTQEKDIKNIKNIENNSGEIDLGDVTQKEYLKSLAIQLLTDSMPTATERYIEKKEGLHDELTEMFIGITPEEFGCKRAYKANLGTYTIRNIRKLNGTMSYSQWIAWKAAYTFVKYMCVSEDDIESLGDKRYAIAMQKYVAYINKESSKYKLSGRDNNLGAKVIRVMEYVKNGTTLEMLPLDENFALELLNGKYSDNLYVNELLRCSGFDTIEELKDNIEDKMPLGVVINRLKTEPTEENLITLINYMIKRGVHKDIQDKILSDNIVKNIMLNVGKNKDTTLTRYCVTKLTEYNDDMLNIVKLAAKNGLGYNTIVALAFPSEVYQDVKESIAKIDDSSEVNAEIETHLKELKSRYCRIPYATSGILQSIRLNVLPKKICQAERKFIQYMQ